ncbi:MAG: leuD [Chloroflexi bacterium]|jgi:3-isopropylmalate/(R)-2-methylmalate dehydratase small subunit|nr:leuD [Chloroflexota bacterium]
MYFEGIAHRYGDDIDTDVILPGPYMNLSTPEELGAHALEGIDPGFARRVMPGDILVVGRNFGCGSSREHAPIALRAAGIACIVAKSYARIFFRNAINIGLPIVIAPSAVEQIADGARVAVDTGAGTIQVGDQVFGTQQVPPFVQALIDAGGLEGFVRQRLAARQGAQ